MSEYVLLYIFTIILVLIRTINTKRSPFVKDVKEFFDEYVYDSFPILSSTIAFKLNTIFDYISSNEAFTGVISNHFNDLEDSKDKKQLSLFVFTLQILLYFILATVCYLFFRVSVSHILNVNTLTKSTIGFVIYFNFIAILMMILGQMKKFAKSDNKGKQFVDLIKTVGIIVCVFVSVGILYFGFNILLARLFEDKFSVPTLPNMNNLKIPRISVPSDLMKQFELFLFEMKTPIVLILMQFIMTIMLWTLFICFDYVGKSLNYNEATEKKRKLFAGGVFMAFAVMIGYNVKIQL
ncbi:hypothetical protein QKU58_gp078 [Pyramimonas orientalis virus]|uniref:Uncharacterized protein n=1 Tax=Pyramimonas orientalis virus 01B TaxID=3134525 RepID=A0A7M3UNJ2_9VIRU|nr:hypothetical protein QKU58_gp078 [Pyramimonas orientalis virus]QOI90253.1 hypothetical protein HWQ62_00116 [Pyramimonas orientalis virus]